MCIAHAHESGLSGQVFFQAMIWFLSQRVTNFPNIAQVLSMHITMHIVRYITVYSLAKWWLQLTVFDPQQLRVPVLLGIGFVAGRTAAASAPGAAVLRWRCRRSVVIVVVIASRGKMWMLRKLLIIVHRTALERSQIRFGHLVILAQHCLQMIYIVDGDAVEGFDIIQC